MNNPIQKVWAVLYDYDCEGYSLEAVYASEELAKAHPNFGFPIEIKEMEVLTQPHKESKWTR